MSILINCAALLAKPTGISVYAHNLIQHLPAREFEVAAPFPLTAAKTHLTPAHLSAEFGAMGHLRRLIWTQRSLPHLYRQVQARLLFSPLPEAPLYQQIPFVVMVHDLIPLRFFARTSSAYLYNRYYVSAIVHAAQHVVCNSMATAQDITHLLGVPAHKITPIPLGYDAQHFRFLNLPRSHYFLVLGRMAPYKNGKRILAAFAALSQRSNYELWLVGPCDARYIPELRAIAIAHGIEAQVKFLDYVAPEALPQLINQAIALVFPSLWEGFGLPVLEAMGCGTPVITSNLAALPEVAGDAALLVDPYNVLEIAAAMSAIATDANLSQTLRLAGFKQAKQFSWARTGIETWSVLQRFYAVNS
jgi:glycosyltransferase involved in cell wall biosynthesis